MALTLGPFYSYIHVCMFVCMCASDFAKVYSYLRSSHRKVASSSPKCCSHKGSKSDLAQESRILTWAVAWLGPMEDCGKTGSALALSGLCP